MDSRRTYGNAPMLRIDILVHWSEPSSLAPMREQMGSI